MHGLCAMTRKHANTSITVVVSNAICNLTSGQGDSRISACAWGQQLGDVSRSVHVGILCAVVGTCLGLGIYLCRLGCCWCIKKIGIANCWLGFGLGGNKGGGWGEWARTHAGPVWFPPVSPGLGGEPGWWVGEGWRGERKSHF